MKFTQGDSPVLKLRAKNEEGYIDLTDAVFETRLKGVGSFVKIPDGQHTADPDQVTNKGRFEIALTTQNTQACSVGPSKDIVVKINISGSVVYVHGNRILTVLSNKPQT